MKRKYYEPDGTINEESFAKRLEELHDEVDGADLNGLLSKIGRASCRERV